MFCVLAVFTFWHDFISMHNYLLWSLFNFLLRFKFVYFFRNGWTLQAWSFLLVTVIIPCNILPYSLQDVEFSRIAEIVIPLSTDP